MVQWYKTNGFHPVALSANDIPAQLKLGTGLIDAAPSPPYLALTLQIFRDAKYMLDLHVAPLVGATDHLERRVEQDLAPRISAKVTAAAAGARERASAPTRPSRTPTRSRR